MSIITICVVQETTLDHEAIIPAAELVVNEKARSGTAGHDQQLRFVSNRPYREQSKSFTSVNVLGRRFSHCCQEAIVSSDL